MNTKERVTVMKRRISKNLVSGILAVLLSSAGAATAQAVDLNEALAQAYMGNPTLEAARASLRAVDESVPEALSGWRPSVIGQVQAGKTWVDQNTPQLLDDDFEPRSYGVTVTQPIFNGFETVSSTSAAEKRVLSGRADLRTSEQDVLFQAVRAYMQVVRDKAVLELNRNNEEVIATQLQATRDRFEAGEVTRTDVAQAESRLQGAVAGRIEAEGNLTASIAIYRQVIGQEPVDLTMPTEKLSLPASRDETVAQAANAPIVVSAKYLAEAVKDDIDVAFSEMLPTVSLEGSWFRNEEQSSSDGSYDEGQILGVLRVPLYQAGAPDARVRRAKQLYHQSRRQIEEASRSSEQTAVDSWQALETAEAQIVSFEEQVRATEVALDGVKQEQLVGARTVLDVLDAELEALNAKVSLVEAQTTAVAARYAVLSAVGRLTAQELALDVGIYDPTEHYDAVRNKFIGTGPSVE
ncbi:TolC family outer membrane protein [Dongia sp.]|uniref:TolC family outer membrane protein n=1 Tax=Dongia sp. TaxID=1977262 RepID=UPI0035B03721